MKRMIALLAALLLVALCGTSLAEVKGKYVWKGHTIEVTHIEHFKQLSPKGIKDNEYTVAVSMEVEEAIWKDGKTQNAFYKEAALLDPQGTAYSPMASGKGVDEPLWVFFFCVPKTVTLEELIFSPGKNGQKVEESKEHAEQSADGPAVLTAEDGSAVTLTPADTEGFKAQADKEIVHTRIGNTAHNGGSVFWPGSALKLSNMRKTKQYAMPMVAFAYQSSLDFDKTVDAIGVIGEKAVLTVEGKAYSAQVAWITPKMACFIFDCPELPSGAVHFTVKDNTLFIEP